MKMRKSMNKNNSIILLSGGLDSLVALDFVKKYTDYNISSALTLDYGQKSVIQEIKASKNICNYYKIEHKIIHLDWLKDITKTSLVAQTEIPNTDFNTTESAAAVWVPNRNGLFLNIAACFCDSFGYKYIIYGANKDEGQTFPDNTEDFRVRINEMFQYSTLVKPIVTAPLINYGKDDIVKIAVRDSVPLELLWSCYSSGEKHCGKCESCNHLKKSLIANQCEKYLSILFKNEN